MLPTLAHNKPSFAAPLHRFVSLQDIPKNADRAPSRTNYTWRATIAGATGTLGAHLGALFAHEGRVGGEAPVGRLQDTHAHGAHGAERLARLAQTLKDWREQLRRGEVASHAEQRT